QVADAVDAISRSVDVHGQPALNGETRDRYSGINRGEAVAGHSHDVAVDIPWIDVHRGDGSYLKIAVEVGEIHAIGDRLPSFTQGFKGIIDFELARSVVCEVQTARACLVVPKAADKAAPDATVGADEHPPLGVKSQGVDAERQPMLRASGEEQAELRVSNVAVDCFLLEVVPINALVRMSGSVVIRRVFHFFSDGDVLPVVDQALGS